MPLQKHKYSPTKSPGRGSMRDSGFHPFGGRVSKHFGESVSTTSTEVRLLLCNLIVLLLMELHHDDTITCTTNSSYVVESRRRSPELCVHLPFLCYKLR